jgi:hypothetical protein
VIGLAFQVGGCGGLRLVDVILDRQPYEHKAFADAIERSSPHATHPFKSAPSASERAEDNTFHVIHQKMFFDPCSGGELNIVGNVTRFLF